MVYPAIKYVLDKEGENHMTIVHVLVLLKTELIFF